MKSCLWDFGVRITIILIIVSWVVGFAVQITVIAVVALICFIGDTAFCSIMIIVCHFKRYCEIMMI